MDKKDGIILHFFNDNKKAIKLVSVAVLICIVVIFAWGYFRAIDKIPWPEDRVPVFDKTLYKPASKIIDSKESVKYIKKKNIEDMILAYIKKDFYSKWNCISFIKKSINKQYGNKFIIISPNLKEFISNSIKNYLDEKKRELITLKNNLEAEYINASYYESYSINQKIKRVNRDIEIFNNFSDYLSRFSVKIITSLPYQNQISDFSFVSGKFTFSDNDSDYNLKINLQEVRPAYKKSFLKKANLLPGNYNKKKLNEDEDLLEKIYKESYKEFKTRKKNIIRNIYSIIAPQRERIRSLFYERWYSTLIITILTLIMLILLKAYYKIIRRKDLPLKTTHNIYFATNVTSKIYRLIAILITIIGMIVLLFNLCKYFALEISPVTIIQGVGYLEGTLSPIVNTFFIVSSSWIFVLLSEFICFLSNVYHIVFKKVYKD